MIALEFAQKEADRLKAQEDIEVAIKAREKEIIESTKTWLKQQIETTLAEFDGVNGIQRRGNYLYNKNEVAIATVSIEWHTWENPNYDYKVEESGHEILYKVLNKQGIWEQSYATYNFAELFGKAMGVHLL
jgi:hypothetical protein